MTFGLLLARKLSLTRAVFYMVMQCLGAICGAGVVKGYQRALYDSKGGGANVVNPGYTKGDGLGAEIVGTFVLVYTVFSATDAKRNARDSHVPVSALSLSATNTIVLFLFFVTFFYWTLLRSEFLVVSALSVDAPTDLGSPAHWVCGLPRPPGHHPHHRNRHKPGEESWSCHHLQQGPRLA